VAEWKRQRREVFVPLTYRPGDLAEVDFFEVIVDIDGTRRKAWLFLMRLMYSGRDFAWIYERQDQISFLDGHVRAFAHFEAVPARIAYDNLKAAVVRILVGGTRTLTPRFTALASHYLLEACFCRPGEGHDKGGVESRGKAIRQQVLVPIPVGPTLAAINAVLLAQMDARLDTTRDATGQTIGTRFTEEPRQCRPVPVAFEAASTTLATATPRALIRLEGAAYSVWTRWAGLDLVIRIGPSMALRVPKIPAYRRLTFAPTTRAPNRGCRSRIKNTSSSGLAVPVTATPNRLVPAYRRRTLQGSVGHLRLNRRRLSEGRWTCD
jgi:hypothetical protein